MFAKDSVVEGFVRFDADGRPADDTKLMAGSCDELDALAEGRRGKELACTARAGILCGRHGRALATAVDVVTHESFHLQGILDEARTECNALQTMARTAERLGATPAQGVALARGQFAESYPLLPDGYRSARVRRRQGVRPAAGRPALPYDVNWSAPRGGRAGRPPRAGRRSAPPARAWW